MVRHAGNAGWLAGSDGNVDPPALLAMLYS